MTVHVRQYVVYIDDNETKVFPYAALDIIEVAEDRISDLIEMADDNATLAQIEAEFGDAFSPQQEA